MIRKFYKSVLAIAFVASISFSNAIAQDKPVDATAAATTAAPAADGDVAKGEELYKNNCAQCHAVTDEVVVGPGLKGIEERRDYAWLKSWINNPMGVIGSGDKYANELYLKYNKTQMTAFANFGDPEVKAVLAYIKSAGTPAALPPGTPPTPVVETGGGKFINTILVALLVIMGLVLVALLGILQLLNRLSGGEATASEASFGQNLKATFKNIAANKTVRSAIVWVFILLATKATFDGMYGIGVHQGYAPKQPIAFSHKLHAGEMKINCAYCHTGVYKGKQSGIPSANICMNCHNAIKRESPEIQKIYSAIENNKPIEWVRVHNLPDLAYFNHAQHTNVGGLDCKNCHGEIDKMEVVQQRSTLTMGWCIDCHRKSEVNGKDNGYYTKLMEAHSAVSKGAMKVQDNGGLECAKCHY
jgi:mono/diheme cytochrome c family protein